MTLRIRQPWLLLALSLSLLGSGASAQTGMRPASEADFTGYWRILLIPDEVHGAELRNEQIGFTGPCQFFVHRADGQWHNISIGHNAPREEALRHCPTRRAELEAVLAANRARAGDYAWRRMNPLLPLYLIEDRGPGGKTMAWKADHVETELPPGPRIGFALHKGDLLLQHARLATTLDGLPSIELVWPMVLRPLAE